jgi:hypothetical protein
MAITIKYYFDEHMPRVVADGLAQRDISVIMAFDAGMAGQPDELHLQCATEQKAVLVTRDKPFAGRSKAQAEHSGVICWTGAQDDFGGMIRVLAAFAENHTTDSVEQQVFWLKT